MMKRQPCFVIFAITCILGCCPKPEKPSTPPVVFKTTRCMDPLPAELPTWPDDVSADGTFHVTKDDGAKVAILLGYIAEQYMNCARPDAGH